jgi:hypothetical protein
MDVRVALATTTAAACAAGATRSLLSSPSVLKSLSPNTVTLALLGDTLGVAVAERVAFMPLLTLVAAHAPAGYEATWYCGLTSVLDWGAEVGQATTAALTRALQVGAPPARSWRHLTAFVLIASATKLCTLPLLLLVRKADPTGASPVRCTRGKLPSLRQGTLRGTVVCVGACTSFDLTPRAPSQASAHDR